MRSRRLLCCIFALILLLGVFPVAASETAGTETLNVQTSSDSWEQAVLSLRQGIKNWEGNIVVSFRMDEGSFDGTAAYARELAGQLLDQALAHTGAPDEGDYLLFNIGHKEVLSANFSRQSDGWEFTFTYYIVYWTTAEQETELDARIEELVQSLDLRNEQLTDYQKVSIIYGYICGNVVYDYEHVDEYYPLMWSTYAAAVQKTAVCQGYATLFYRLAQEAGLDNRVISGMAKNPQGEQESHAWNLVRLDGQYYYVDSTWDAEQYTYYWFLKTQAEFIDHDPDAEYLTEEFLSAYPVSEFFYQHPVMDNAVEGDFTYRVFNGKAGLVKYTGTDRDVVIPTRLGGYPVEWIGSCSIADNPYVVSVTISEGIRTIESEAIYNCKNLKSIHIPSTANFTASEYPDFLCRVICGASYCPSVEEITVAEGNPYLTVYDGVLYNKNMTILRYYPAGDPRETFQIPEGVLAVGGGAFAYNGQLKELIMPDTVIRLQMSSFANCTKLESVRISEGCTFIDQYVFSETALETIHIPASVKMLYYGSFGLKSKLSSITVDTANSFYYSIDGVLYGRYTPENVTDSCHMEFLGDWLVRYPAGRDETSFTVPEGIVGIEQDAFTDITNLEEVILPQSLQRIESESFYYCTGLIRIELPENLKEIGAQPFWGCSSLTELVIPASVKKIEYYIVGQGGGDSLEQVIFLGDAPEMFDQTFAWRNVRIYYPAGNETYGEAIKLHAAYPEAQWIELCENHQFVDKVRESSCILTGYTGRECSVCGLVEITGEFAPAVGHTLGERITTEPSCENWGSSGYACAVCNAWIEEESVAPLGHDFDENGNCTRCSRNKNQLDEQDDAQVQAGVTSTVDITQMIIVFCVILGLLVAVPLLVMLFKKK